MILGMDKGKVALVVVCVALLVGLVFLVVYLKSVADYQRAVKDLVVREVALTDVADGTFAGACDVGFISAKVEVTVQAGRITDIALVEHKNERGAPAEAIIGDMVAAQRIDVDAVTGATNSSTVLKKAVENALRKGL
ncbi:FMN-binding protein [Arabiibacter massiliensis]|uniref:FMN-binding protein n=1 Tax=Arabiibacter massiliensis TaxID=1870985 RepID=UPI0009BC1189|nr:FMN-binding protein [Arabiibacter massiliensis]